jgi:hypothetical protein
VLVIVVFLLVLLLVVVLRARLRIEGVARMEDGNDRRFQCVTRKADDDEDEHEGRPGRPQLRGGRRRDDDENEWDIGHTLNGHKPCDKLSCPSGVGSSQYTGFFETEVSGPVLLG